MTIAGTLHEDQCTFVVISGWKLVKMDNVSGESCGENQNTHFTFETFSPKSFRLWDDVKKRVRIRQATEDNTMPRLRFASWIYKERIKIHTHTVECLLLVHGNNGYSTAPHCCTYIACLIPYWNHPICRNFLPLFLKMERITD